MAQGDSLRDGADGTVGFKWTCADPLFRVGNESVIIDPLFCSSQGVRVGFTLSPENCIELILVQREIGSLTAGLPADQSVLGNPASVFHPLK